MPSFPLLEAICIFLFAGGPHLQHMKVPRVGVESEPQLPAYAPALQGSKPRLRPAPQLTATPDP